MERISLCPACTACPEVVIEGDTIRIGEDANTAVLKKDGWNVLVDLIGRVSSDGSERQPKRLTWRWRSLVWPQ